MENSFAAAIPIAITFTLSGFGIAYYYLTTRSRERLALIEKGLAPSAFAQSRSYLPLLLLLGVLSMGIAAGIAAGAALTPKRAHILTARLQPFALATWRPRTYSPRDLVPGEDRSGCGGEDMLRRTLSEDPSALQVQSVCTIRQGI